MKRLIVSLFLFMLLSVQASWFDYDRGIAAAHDGDDERAVKLLTDELTSYPEKPALLYDSGVLAARQKNYEQAEAFFLKAVRFSASDNQLHQQALFNLGNTYVATDKLHEALNTYNQLLALDSQNERARHNCDVVRKMLEQQAQNQEQDGSQQNNQERDNSQQDNKKDSQGNSKQQQSQGDQQQGNKNSSEQQQNGAQKDGAGKKQNGQSQGNQQQSSEQQESDKRHKNQQYGNNCSARGQGQQKNKQGSAEQQEKESAEQAVQDKQKTEKDAAYNGQQSAEQKAVDQQSPDGTSPDGTSPDGTSRNQDNQKRDGKNSNQLDERDGYKERYSKWDSNADSKDKQQSGSDKSKGVKSEPDDKEGGNDQRTQQHDDSPSRARGAHKDGTTSKTMKVGSKVQESDQKKTKKQYAAWAESMLDAVQLNDEALNKVLVQRAVAGNLGGRDGECCW
jgi:hypothetical protein